MPHNFIPTSFDVGYDLVVIGYNPENSDYDNRRGEIYGYHPYVRAVDARGNTMVKYSHETFGVYVGADRACAEAEAEAKRLNENLLKRLRPTFDSWQEGRPMYGSEAYQEYGAAEDLAWERSMEDEAY